MKEENKLWGWFGLSYARWLTIPRVFLHEMPIEWQNKLADLLDEYDNVFSNQPDIGTRVSVTKDGKLIKTPSWLLDYRHPSESDLAKVKT
jgi:hypothetical protein